jgi:hypothetical protein
VRLEAHGEINIVAVQQTTTRAGDASIEIAKVDGAKVDGGRAENVRADAGGAADGGTMAVPAAVTSRSVTGRIALAAGGVSVFPSGPLVDLSLDLPLTGDASAPIPIAGVLSFAAADPTGGGTKAAASAAVRGVLDLTTPAVTVELAGQTGPIPCLKSAAVPNAPAATAKETNGVAATIAMTLDDLPGARVSFQAQAQCTPKLR